MGQLVFEAECSHAEIWGSDLAQSCPHHYILRDLLIHFSTFERRVMRLTEYLITMFFKVYLKEISILILEKRRLTQNRRMAQAIQGSNSIRHSSESWN